MTEVVVTESLHNHRTQPQNLGSLTTNKQNNHIKAFHIIKPKNQIKCELHCYMLRDKCHRKCCEEKKKQELGKPFYDNIPHVLQNIKKQNLLHLAN